MDLRKIMKDLVKYFLQGLLFTLPIAATCYVIYQVFISLDGILPFDIPGLGLLIILTGITILGYLSRFYFGNPVSNYIGKAIERTPLIKLIYSSVKDLIAAFVGEKKRFNNPVLVTMSHQPLIQRIGFVTQSSLEEMGFPSGKIAVYLPFSYGVNGILIVVESENIVPIDVSGTDMMKFIISGGVSDISDIGHPSEHS